MSRNQVRTPIALLFSMVLTVAVYAQAPSRVLGSVTAISGRTLTVKSDKGEPVTVEVSDTARIVRTEPGAKSLAGATAISLTDIAIGDRVLVIVNGGTATTVIAMRKADIAQKQSEQAADWQKRGAGGIVKTVDASSGIVTIASGVRTLTIHTTPQTIIRRYSPDSASFADSKPSALQAIHPGDQLRVRGDRSADGSTIKADEIVAGSFRNIAGLVLNVKSADNAMTVRDLATKKTVTIHITPQTQMHKLSAESAQMIAARLKPAGGAAGNGQHRASAQPATSAAQGASGGSSGRALSQMIRDAAPISLSALRKGDAVMIVATMGTPDSANAVTLLAGVEPILTASPSSGQNMLSAWSLGSGGSGGGGGSGSGDQGGGPQ